MNKSYRENRRGNQEWTIERYRQHWTTGTRCCVNMNITSAMGRK